VDMYPSSRSSMPSGPSDYPPPRRATRRNWWLRLTSWEAPQWGSTLQDRERARRSQLASWLILGIGIVIALLLPLGLGDFGTLVALLIAAAGLVFAAALNRNGNVGVAGVLLVVLISGAVFGAVLDVPGGLSTDTLPAYDLLSIAVVVASTVIWHSAGFIVAAFDGAFVCLDFFLQLHSTDLVADIASYGDTTVAALTLLLRPIALLVILAVVSYLWVRSMEQAVQRADRAEELAALEHAIADQKRQLDFGIQQILATHIRAANGDFTARAPLNQENVLWQIAFSLNNLLGRLQRAGQAEARLARTEDEIHRLEAAFREARSGRTPRWPAPSGTAVDGIVQMLAPNAGHLPSTPQASTGGLSGPSVPGNWAAQNSSRQPPTPGPFANLPQPRQPLPWTQTGYGPRESSGAPQNDSWLPPNEDGFGY